jgi:hypothetical protein
MLIAPLLSVSTFLKLGHFSALLDLSLSAAKVPAEAADKAKMNTAEIADFNIPFMTSLLRE